MNQIHARLPIVTHTPVFHTTGGHVKNTGSTFDFVDATSVFDHRKSPNVVRIDGLEAVDNSSGRAGARVYLAPALTMRMSEIRQVADAKGKRYVGPEDLPRLRLGDVTAVCVLRVLRSNDSASRITETSPMSTLVDKVARFRRLDPGVLKWAVDAQQRQVVVYS